MNESRRQWRALSLTQPWASLVILGLKQFETRSWSTPFRGRLVIHAAKGFPPDAREFADDLANDKILPAILPRGVLLGGVDMTDCLRTEMVAPLISPTEDTYGDFHEGRYAFQLHDPRPFTSPIPCRGALGLWAVPAEYVELLNALYDSDVSHVGAK